MHGCRPAQSWDEWPADLGAQLVMKAGRPGGLRLFMLLGGVTAIGPASFSSYLPALPDLAEDFGVGVSAVQLTLTTYLIGLAVGQFLPGPLSDVHGRRRPLIAGLALFSIASLCCSLAPNLAALATLRFVQGATVSAGLVIGRAVVRDLFAGAPAARYLSRLTLISGLGPMLAPLVGAVILGFTSWRGVFVFVALLGFALAVTVACLLPETHPHDRRREPGIGVTARTLGGLLRERRFLGFVLLCGLSSGAIWAYLSSSSFVLQEAYGASPKLYGVLYGGSALAAVAGAQVSAHLVMRHGPERLIGVGLATMVTGAASLTALVSILPDTGLGVVMVPLILLNISWSFIQSNAMAAALTDHPRVAGTASGLIGVSMFIAGAVVAPLVGLGGDDTALPMAVVVLTCAIGATLSFRFLVTGSGRPQVDADPVAGTWITPGQ